MRQLFLYIIKNKFWQRLWLPVLVEVAASIVTLLLWRSLLINEHSNIHQQIALTTVNTTELINQQIDTRVLALNRMAKRWEFRGGISKPEWEADVNNYLQGYPGFQAIEWVDSSFHVRWIAPLAGNEAAQNLHLGSEARRRIALEAALQRRDVAMSRTVELVQGGKGFLVYIPLFFIEENSQSKIQNPKSKIQNPKSKIPFDGFILGVFRAQSLLDEILEENITKGYAIAIFDGDEEIYRRENSSISQEIAAKWAQEKELNLYGVTWRVRVLPTPALLEKEQTPLPTVVLVAGEAVSLLLGLSVYFIQAARRHAKQVGVVNQELAKEITERKKTEIALRQSEQRYATLAEGSPVSIFRTDVEGHCLYTNPSWCEIAGMSSQEAIGEGWAKNLHPEDRDRVFSEWYEAAQKNIPFSSEYRFLRPDYTVTWVFGQAVAEKDENGKLIGYIGTLTDITARKQAEAELHWKEALLRSMANSSPLAFYVVDERTNNVLYFNHRFCEIWGIECLTEAIQLGEFKQDTFTINFAEGQDNSKKISVSVKKSCKQVSNKEKVNINITNCADCQPNSRNISAFIEACKPFTNEENRTVLEDEIPLTDGRIIRRFSTQIRDDQDEYFGRLYIFEDITERKRAEKELLNLNLAMESAVVGISQIDTQGRYIKVNPAYASMLGYQPEELIGMECILTVHPEEREKMQAIYQQMLAEGRVEAETRAVRKDGSIFDQQVVMIKAYDQQQQFVGCYRFMKDISDRREIERLKDEFVSVVSHELRTPLTSISAALDLLAHGVLQSEPEEAQRMLNIAANNTDRLVRLINDILDIERIESGKVQMTKQVCDAADLMFESAQAMEEMAEQAGVKLSVSLKNADLLADGDRIIQVLTNLLSNAIKFSPPGSTVWLSAELGNGQGASGIGQGASGIGQGASGIGQGASGIGQGASGIGQGASGIGQGASGMGKKTNSQFPIPNSQFPMPNAQCPTPYLLFQVKDQGRGIPADKLESIFERFQQVDASDSRQKGGTGLGLAICRSILQQHNGQIWAESTLGEGSTFFFTLPILPEDEGEKGEQGASDNGQWASDMCKKTNAQFPMPNAQCPMPNAQFPMPNPQCPTSPLVLLCDDDPDIRTVVQIMLEQQGYQVLLAASGQEAVDTATKQHPAAIILNLMMPGMNGWETLAILKQQPETQNIPVIILSGLLPNANNILPDGISNWILKPPNINLLCQSLEQATSKQNQVLKVLVVEDDLDLAEILNTMFARHGVSTFHAQTGREAIQLSQSIIPDMLVLDLGLPEWNGFVVVDWLRQHNYLCHVPLVVYTAYDLDESDRQRLKLGQTLFFTKGRITPQEFEQRVIHLLNRMIPGKELGVRS